ncbi:MAG: hypothetical protein DRJ59_05325 [Thermoprotei archaeon]|nr:MAG: hypothetical protein DRJ59_05325 [Thermoprotei archaeon]
MRKMVERFCAICGKRGTILIDNLCADCYRKQHPLIDVPPLVKITLCRSCYSYYDRGKWMSPQAQETIYDVIMRAIKARVSARIKERGRVIGKELQVDFKYPKEGTELPVILKVTGSIHEEIPPYVEEYRLTAIVHFELCPSCRIVVGGKEKAIVQVRAKGRSLSKKEKRVIEEIVREELARLYERDKGAVVLEKKEDDGRIDFYLASVHAARQLAHSIQQHFSGKILETQKVLGISRTGRTITRSTIRVLIPPFKEGDIIILKNVPHKILRIQKASVKVLSLQNFEEKSVSLARLFKEDIKIIDEKDVGLIMSVKPPSVLVLSLSKYETLDLYFEKIPFWMKENESVMLVKWEGKVYIAPLTTRRS